MVVTVITLLIIVAMAIFFWRVISFERAIQRGDLSSLPQYSSQASVLSGSVPKASDIVYDVDKSDAPSIGPKNAGLVVVEFLDFQCPYCGDAFPIVRSMQSKYGDKVRFVARNFPLTDIHAEAMQAAEAASCADAQGKYWMMHDRLFARRGVLSRSNLDEAAQASGLDMKLYKICMDTHTKYGAIRQDISAGTAAGVRGTPTFFFNGRRIEGVIPEAPFDQIIQSMLK